ncbi:hypothetical protein L5515_004931 [Caenorhabditis briggsae]|uniref:Protein CBR-ZIF-1 n=1 Tax=Caenorhabditis briggsae TaxID=6238 RepID=A0AAE9JE63_CAEBR|nr:hypothetical protein L5515_004931 [Caenorhabditis briggsae]
MSTPCSTASASSSSSTPTSPSPTTSSTNSTKFTTPLNSEKPLKLCVNEIPWKMVPQTCEEYEEYEFLDDTNGRLSDAESFVWKWSPCGRYGVDMPGGRENINQELKDRLAMFDLHNNFWTLYTIEDGGIFKIPRVCFLYWVTDDIIGTVSLVKGYEPGPDDEIRMKFKQAFYVVCHSTQKLFYAGSCLYRTEKTIVASYWYHIFENRHGEPFVDHNGNIWLVFSNGSDTLILLPFVPSPKIRDAKFVTFDMNQIVSQIIGTRVFLDPFMCAHYVPYVFQNEINFFIRIDNFSFIEDHERDYSAPTTAHGAKESASRGVYQLRINLRNVIERGEKLGPVETSFTRQDVNLSIKLFEDFQNGHMCIAQHRKDVVIHVWQNNTVDMVLTKKINARTCKLESRLKCCSQNPRDASFCTIDLKTGSVRKFDAFILGTDVIQIHPTGSLFMFRYKEIYAMTFCELPYFPPISLVLKCKQVLNKCVIVDPECVFKQCCLKSQEEEVY